MVDSPNYPTGYPVPKSKSNKKILWVVIVVCVIFIAGYFGFNFYKQNKISKIVPSFFVEGVDSNIQIIRAEKTDLMKLVDNESLVEEAVTYSDNRLRSEVTKDFYAKIKNNGWIAVDGTVQQGDRAIFKVVDQSKNILLIAIEGGLNEPPTTVKIFRVLKNI